LAVFGAVTALRRTSRFLGVAFFIGLGVMLMSGSSRPDRIAGLFPGAIALGAVELERVVARPAPRVLALTVVAVLAAPLVPLVLPILEPDTLARYSGAVGLAPQIERGKAGALPQWFADRFGWRELAEQAAQAVAELADDERAHTVLVGSDYGAAGALDLYGPRLGLPRVISTHNAYWDWGPGDFTGVTTVIEVGDDPTGLRRLCDDVRRVGTVHCRYCFTDGRGVWVGRNLKLPVETLWPLARQLR
jgi:hypothetical protein